MSTLKLKSFSVDIKHNFCVDLKNVDLNNYTHINNDNKIEYHILYSSLKHDQKRQILNYEWFTFIMGKKVEGLRNSKIVVVCEQLTKDFSKILFLKMY